MTKILRASKAGFPCDRNLWYSVHGYAGMTEESAQRIFDVGTYLEPMVVEWLRSDGWEVEYNPGSQQAECEISLKLDGGEIHGHPDCIISHGELRNVLVDIKTMNDRAFALWKREGTEKSKPQYVDQVHVYAQGLIESGRNIEMLGIVGLNKNNSDLHIDLFKYDSARIAEILERSERVMKAQEVPTENSPREAWCCNYCEYADMCSFHRRPKPADIDASVEYTEDARVIDAMRELMSARELGKESRDMEAYAKSVLDEHIKAQGSSRIAGGGLMFSLSERTRGTFDSAAFKKDHPELAGQYIKTSTSVFYEVKEIESPV